MRKVKGNPSQNKRTRRSYGVYTISVDVSGRNPESKASSTRIGPVQLQTQEQLKAHTKVGSELVEGTISEILSEKVSDVAVSGDMTNTQHSFLDKVTNLKILGGQMASCPVSVRVVDCLCSTFVVMRI